MPEISWQGVMPAITTAFAEDGSVDHAFMARHASWMVDHGTAAIVPLGSLGESATLDAGEKEAVLRNLVGAVDVPVIPGIAALSTRQAVQLARMAADAGCAGLMVLPPWVYRGSWRETRAHLLAVMEATPLPCMLYNNPIAYGIDVLPEQVEELAGRCGQLRAVKDSGGDVRRITAVRARLGDRLALFAGLDDMVLEATGCGATGWVAGLVNALPAESVELYRRCREGPADHAFDLYSWFLPLLRLDTVPEFVQLIKMVQSEVGMGSTRVRPPRLPLEGAARDQAASLIRDALAARPRL